MFLRESHVTNSSQPVGPARSSSRADVTTLVTFHPPDGRAAASKTTWTVIWLRHALRICALVTAAATLALASVAGLGFLWCAPMEEARLHCCCPAGDAEERDVLERHCCERREAADMPSARLAAAFDLGAHPPAPLPAVVLLEPRPITQHTPALRSGPRPISRARGSPERRLHAVCSVYLL